MGDTLRQWIDDQLVYHCQLASVQLWKQDAQAALASGNLGLCALSPLMAGASEQVVLQALDTILRTATPPQQSNLLSILTTFSEPWVSTEHILQLVGKERLMESKIWNTLLAEAMGEAKAEIKAEAKAEAMDEATKLHINDMQQTLENALITRFPQAPVRLMRDIRQLSQSSQFNDLIIALVAVQDVEEFEHKLQEVLHVGKN
jgi:hypothetical protein